MAERIQLLYHDWVETRTTRIGPPEDPTARYVLMWVYEDESEHKVACYLSPDQAVELAAQLVTEANEAAGDPTYYDICTDQETGDVQVRNYGQGHRTGTHE